MAGQPRSLTPKRKKKTHILTRGWIPEVSTKGIPSPQLAAVFFTTTPQVEHTKVAGHHSWLRGRVFEENRAALKVTSAGHGVPNNCDLHLIS